MKRRATKRFRRNQKKGATVNQQEQARRALMDWHQIYRPRQQRCGAHAKGTGEPCRQIAMANGRCAYHGGRTPRGDDWHKPKWPNGDAPDFEKKLARKLQDRQRAEKQRQKRVAAMTPEDRERYEQWHQTHRSGSAAERARLRQERKRNAETRKRVAEMERVEAGRASAVEARARRIAFATARTASS